MDDDFTERLEDLEQPLYVTLTYTDDGVQINMSTNLAETAMVRRMLSQAMFEIADDPDWENLGA